MRRRPTRRLARARGFTLVELLVALGLLALMAALSWRGLDGMTRAQQQLQQQSDAVLALQAGLDQWRADLDALASQPNLPSLDWDGRALRLLRRDSSGAEAGLTVVAWARRDIDGQGQWLRWQSPALTTRGDLQLAWQQAAQWAQNPGDAQRRREVRLAALDQWQIFFYRGNAWSNPLSSSGATPDAKPLATPALPDGVRLVLTLPPGPGLGGVLTRDWARPELGGGK